jgi:hypothetical protein
MDEIENNDLITIDKFSEIEKLYFIRINNFYKNLPNNDIQSVFNIITKNKSKISLRFLDWFVTKYCKMYNTIIKVNNKYTNNDKFNINIHYKAQLRSYKKDYMDPFKRQKSSKKFKYECGDYIFVTSLCQLNFMKWIVENDILLHVNENYEKLYSKIDYVNLFYKKNKGSSSTNSSLNTIDTDSSFTVDINFNKIDEKDSGKKIKKSFVLEL